MTTGKMSTTISMKRVTVVIPTRDRHELVHRAAMSVLRQTGVTVEVVIVDDGSERPVVAPDDPRATVIRNRESTGVSSARNAGIERAKYEWVAFLDDDDFWAPTKLVEQLAALTLADAKWCVTGAVLVDLKLQETAVTLPKPEASDIGASLCNYNAVPGGGSGVVVERSLLAEIGGFDENLSMVADWEMWHRIAHRYPCAIVRRPLVAYTVHDMSMTRTFDGYDDEMRGLAGNSSLYCEASVENRRMIYDGWLAGHIVRTDRVRAARMKAGLAFQRKSFSDLLMAARFLLIPHTFSGRRLLRLPPKHDPIEPTPWLAEYRRQHSREFDTNRSPAGSLR
jgi:glycosyltransferase involved in cell wall biosynthesis